MSPLILVGILVMISATSADVKHVLEGSAHPPDPNSISPEAVNYLATNPPAGDFWWMNPDSPLKAAYDHYKKGNVFKPNCLPAVSPPQPPIPQETVKIDIKKNPFFNGNYQSDKGSASFSGDVSIDISKNPFLSGAVVTTGNGAPVVKGQDGFLGVQPAQPFAKKSFATSHPLAAQKKPFDTEHPTANTVECKSSGYGCVPKESCVDGVIGKSDGLLQVRSDVHYCNKNKEECCRLTLSATLDDITAGKSSVPGASIKFAGNAGLSPGLIQVLPDQPLNIKPDLYLAGEHGHHSSSSTPKSIRDTSSGPNSVFSSTVDYSDTKFGDDVRFASTFQGPAYLPPVGPATTPTRKPPSGPFTIPVFVSPGINEQFVPTRPTTSRPPPSTIREYLPPGPTTQRPTYTPYVPGPSVTPQKPYQPSVTPQKPYQPSVTPQKPYQPTTQRPYQPGVTAQQPYQPSITPQRPYQPSVTPQQPYQPSITPQKPYQPTTQRPYQPSVTPQQPYQPSITPQKPYQPSVTPQQPYQPSVTPQKPYQPSVTTQRPYQPSITPQKPYQPSITPQQPYQPSITTQRPYQPSITPQKPYQPSVTPQQPYQPSITPQKPYQPSPTTPRPYQPYQPSTQKPTTSREYLPPRPSSPFVPQPSSPRPNPFLPQQTTSRPTPPPFRPTDNYQYPTPSPSRPSSPPFRPTSPPFRPQPSTGTYPYPSPSSPRPNPFLPQQPSTPGPSYTNPQFSSPSTGYIEPSTPSRSSTTLRPYQPPSTQRPYQPPSTQRPYQPPTTQRPYQPPITQKPYQPPSTLRPYQPPSTQRPFVPTSHPKPSDGYVYPKPTPTFGYPSTTTTPVITGSNINNQYVQPPKKPTNGYLPPAPNPDQSGDSANVDATFVRPSTPRPTFNGGLNTEPPTACAAALKCVQEIYCTAEGVISPVPVTLSEEQKLIRVPTTECRSETEGFTGKCCRDPNYVDPWPSANLVDGFDDGQYKEDNNFGQYQPDLQRNVRSDTSKDLRSNNVLPQCGERHQNTNPRGRGPLDVNFAEIPWQAMVLRDSNRSLLCGGAIIRRDAVLTAAHCVEGLETSDILIKGGEWKLGIDEEPLPFQIVNVAVVVRHPLYQPGSLLNDLALLILEEKLRPSKNIGTICLPPPNQIPTENCIATGWGKRILQLHAKGAIMHSVDVKIMDNKQCQQTLADKFQHAVANYSPNTLCGYSNIDQCKVDYGSALACANGNQYVLSGIYAWDTGCKQEGQIGGYIAPDVEWIESCLAKPINELKKLEH